MATVPERTKVFISYSHKDTRHLDRLHVHLAHYERLGLLESWDDTKIVPGTNWRKEIEIGIASARVAILLVSADFLASKFITENELPPLLAAAKTRGATILPIILSPCGFEASSLSQFQALNTPSKPLSKLNRHEKEETWARVSKLVFNIMTSQKQQDLQITRGREQEGSLISTVATDGQATITSKQQDPGDQGVPPSDNPYYSTAAIHNPALFFDRSALIEHLLSKLFIGAPECLSLVGPRKSGKTSLLKHLIRSTTIAQFDYDASQYRLVYMDCAKHSSKLSSAESFYHSLVTTLYEEIIETLPNHASIVSVNLVNSTNWQKEWEQLLQQLLDHHYFVIMILDEFDAVIRQENLLRDNLFGSLRMYGLEQNFAWITCTKQRLPTLFKEAYEAYNIPVTRDRAEADFYDIFSGYYPVGLFDWEGIENLISIPSQSKGVIFSREELQAIRRFGGRFPYFVQRACYHFFEAHLRGEVIPEAIMWACVQETRLLWQHYWDKLTLRQQRILFSIASSHLCWLLVTSVQKSWRHVPKQSLFPFALPSPKNAGVKKIASCLQEENRARKTKTHNILETDIVLPYYDKYPPFHLGEYDFHGLCCSLVVMV